MNHIGGRRSKERFISEAIMLVQQWRDYFENGILERDGSIKKVSLQQAAELVGISKKTLEDYRGILRKASQFIDLSRLRDQKMGYLRALIKEYDHNPKQKIYPDFFETQQHSLYNTYNREWDNMIIESDNFNGLSAQSELINEEIFEHRMDFIQDYDNQSQFLRYDDYQYNQMQFENQDYHQNKDQQYYPCGQSYDNNQDNYYPIQNFIGKENSIEDIFATAGVKEEEDEQFFFANPIQLDE